MYRYFVPVVFCLPAQSAVWYNGVRMFGYVTPEKPELRIREYETFRAYYCGLCKTLAGNCGQLSRLVLSYDATFLAVLLSSLVGKGEQAVLQRCPLHPLKRRPVIKSYENVMRYAADINVILAYHNLRDNYMDEKSLKSLAAAAFLRNAAVSAGRRNPGKLSVIKEKLKGLRDEEKNGTDSMDRAAEPFAKLMEEVLAFETGELDGKDIQVLRWIGYNLGKWLYVIDACDDIEDDLRNGSYNPLLLKFGKEGLDMEDIKEKMKKRTEFNLTYCLSEISKGIGLLNIRRNRGIIENIVYMGMLRKTEQILGTGSCGEVEKSV